MSNDNEKKQNPQNPDAVPDNYGMPENWTPVDAPPLNPNRLVAPPPSSGADPFGSGPLPPNLGYQPALVKTGYGPSTGPISLVPIGPSGNPQFNSAVLNAASNAVSDVSGTPGPAGPAGPTGPTGPAGPGGPTGNVNKQTSSYLAVGADSGSLISFDITSAATLTLPATPPSSSWLVFVENNGSAMLTISPNSRDLDYLTNSIMLGPNQGVTIFTDGTNYFTERGMSDGLTHGTTPTVADPTVISWVDDFKYQTADGASGNVANANINETGWLTINGNGSAFTVENWSGGVFPHLGVMQITNDNTSNGFVSMVPQNQLENSASGTKESWPLLDYPGWKMTWIFQFLRGPNSGAGGSVINNSNTFSLAKTSCYIGMVNPGGQPVLNGTGPGRPWVFLGLRYDTDPGTALTLTSVANAAGGNTVYTGTITGGGGTNALVNRYFTVAGFTHSANNGRFLCVASTSTTLTLVNASGVSETHAATATTDAISDSTMLFEYVTNPNPGLNNANPRNNTQGQTFNTTVTPTEGAWYRLDLVCAASGVVTLTLSGGGSTLATWTVTCTTVSYGNSSGTGSLASVANGIGNLAPDYNYVTGNMMDSYFGVGSKISIASTTSAFSGITGSQLCYGDGTKQVSAASAISFYTSASSFSGTSGNAVVTGYPAFMPYLSFGNDTEASPTANTKSLNVDYFSFVWNPALATSPAALNPGYSRYIAGS